MADPIIYYVNTAADAGGDGTTQELTGEHCAFKTIAQVNAASPAAGDSVLFNKGNTWREQLTVSTSGSTGNVITFGAYGEGADPIISGADIINNATYKWTLSTGLGPVVFQDTFESESFSESWDSTDGTVDTWANFGISGPSGGGSYGASWASGSYNLFTTTAVDEMWAKVWVYTGDLTTRTYFIEGRKDGGGTEFSIRFDETSKKLYAYCDSCGTGYEGTNTFSDNTWYQIKVRFKVNETTGALQVWNGETLEIDQTGINSGSVNIAGFRIGSTTACKTVYMDYAQVHLSPSNEYYLEIAAGGDSGISEPQLLFMDDTKLTVGTVGSLADHEWDWADNDSLGYSTVYFRDDSGDPDDDGIVLEAGQRGSAILINDKSYVTFDGLELKHGNGSYDGLFKAYDVQNVILQNSTIHDANYAVIHLFYNDGPNVINNVIDNCTIYNVYSDAAATVMVKLEGENVDSNTIKNCEIYGYGSIGDGDFIFILAGDSNIIENNYIHGAVGNAIYLRDGASSNIIRYNLLEDIGASGMGIQCRGNAGTNNDNEFYYNILDNIGISIQTDGDYDVGNDGTKIYNNTVYNTGADDNGIHIINTNTNCLVKNNIVVVGAADAFSVAANSAAGTTSDNNCFRNTSGTLVSWDGDTYALAQFATYQAAKSQDANSFTSDPLVTDPANDNFHLNPHSPCINAGTDVSLTEDYEGLRIRHAPDIGAYENQTNVLFFSWNYLRKFWK